MNFCESPKVPAPKSDADSIPVVVRSPPREISWECIKAPALVFDIVFHPSVLTKCITDTGFKIDLIDLAYECLEQQKENAIRCVRKYKEYPAFPEESKATPNGRDPSAAELLAQMQQQQSQSATTSHSPMDNLMNVKSNIAGSGPDHADQPSLDSISKLLAQTTGSATLTASSTIPTSQPLSSSNPLPTQATGESSEIAPDVDLTNNVIEKVVTVNVVLPGMQSAADIELEPTDSQLVLLVPGKYKTTITFPRKVDPDTCKAKFVRKTATLKLTFGFAS
jgi:hypothetical protein